MDLQVIMNSPGLWIASSFTVLAVVAQSFIFLREAIKEANKVGLSKKIRKRYAFCSDHFNWAVNFACDHPHVINCCSWSANHLDEIK